MRFYITIGCIEDDDNQQTVTLSREQLDKLYEVTDQEGLSEELSTAIDKVQGDAKIAENP